jgi:hypothetical protein
MPWINPHARVVHIHFKPFKPQSFPMDVASDWAMRFSSWHTVTRKCRALGFVIKPSQIDESLQQEKQSVNMVT